MNEKRDREIRFILILLIIGSFTVSGGCINDFEEESSYTITDIEMATESVKSSYVDLNVTAYIMNRGSDSETNTKLAIKAFSEQTGLLEMSQEKDIETIENEGITAVSQSIRLPKQGSFILLFNLYEDEKRKASSSITIRNLDGMPTDLQEVGIQISGMDFMVKNVTSGKVLIENDIYVKNEGSKSTDNYRILVKAREIDARLLADKEWTVTGNIEPEATAIRTVSLTVPDNYNYVVEVSVWDGDIIVMTGEDYVQLNPEKVISNEEKVQNKNIQTSDFVIEEDFETEMPVEETYPSEESPGFGATMAIVTILSALLIITKGNRRGKHE
ncbi:DUF7490 domain-containing protein [Methanolobus halotolerans]|uniref:DUF7490 domain-containing protein n=1 Tax=Methanolobus halotolerans TaxID=2052935 RepID=A0A4E0PWL0_9EURY|nr:hypothetical protein [Methanolobus halotolerans]TGC08938.1 hypothetical protein CUN85_07850 [Methanolobus halotolerans]